MKNFLFSENYLVRSLFPVTRILNEDDWFEYRALRKRILDVGEGKYFNTSYARENELGSEAAWRAWCQETQEHCIIGTFIDGRLIGVMMVTMLGSHEDLTTEWEATWLDPKYRGLGLAIPAYEMVSRWTKEHGYKYATVYIREDNLRSRRIREKQGFVYMKTINNEVWADGSIASEHLFIKNLYSLPTIKYPNHVCSKFNSNHCLTSSNALIRIAS